MNNRPIDRLFKYIDFIGFSAFKFENEAGISNGYLSKQKERKGQIGSEILDKIHSSFENLNILWIISGDGQMLVDKIVPKTVPNAVPINKTGETASDYEGRQNVIMFDQKLAAGFPEIVTKPAEIDSLPRFTLPQLMFRMGTFYCFPIKGDSMHPTVKDKEWLITQSINIKPNEVRGGRVYGVFTTDYGIDGALCKRLYYKKGEKSIKLVSDNETHVPYRESLENVLYIFEAVVRVSDDFRNWNNDLRRDIDSLRTRMINIERRLPE